MPKKLGVHQIYVRRVFKWEGLKCCKRKFTKADFWKRQRPDSRSLVGSSWPWWLKKPTTTDQAVMDGESFFINTRLLDNFSWVSEKKGAREVGNPSWLGEESQITSGERRLCERWKKNVFRTVMSKVKTCLSKALDQSSRGFWYFEHLNHAYRAAQTQNSTQVDGFYHTFCSTSILSTFLVIGP